jgi:hypothetical protein
MAAIWQQASKNFKALGNDYAVLIFRRAIHSRSFTAPLIIPRRPTLEIGVMGRPLNMEESFGPGFFARSMVSEEEQGIRLQRKIALNLTRFRQLRGLSLNALAERSGTNLTALQEAESGEAMPSLGLLWKVARALDVSCLALTGGSDALRGTSRQPASRVNFPV